MKKIILFIVASLIVAPNSFCTLKENKAQTKIALKSSVRPVDQEECALIVLGCTLCVKGAFCCTVCHNHCLGLSCCAFGLFSYLSSQSDSNKVKKTVVMNRG